MRHKKEPLKMAKSLIYSALANLRGERGILHRFYNHRKSLIISTIVFQKNAILPIFVANLSQDKAL